jgi:hypothetical protein
MTNTRELRYRELKIGNVYAFFPMIDLSPDSSFYLLLRKEKKTNWTSFEFLEMPSGNLKTGLAEKNCASRSDFYLISSCGGGEND